MSNNSQDGVLDHEIRVDTEQMEQDINRGIAQFERLGDAATREGENIQNTMSQIGKYTAAYFSVQALRSFAQGIVQVRGEIESLEISFETLLGSKDKADAMFGSIREFAVNTPMTMNALASGAQTLLGFGIEAEKVMPTLKAIGDISMGDAQKFNSLTLAFAQASSAGKLAGQDFLQMVNAGFNPLNEMARTTGKSFKELKKDMEDGKISTAMLEAAFMSATAEGGQFHGMLEKQSQGIQGALSNLQGAWDDMLNDIGSKQQSVFVDGVDLLTDLIKNYEPFLDAILSIAAAYGTYKAALMAVFVIEKARALAENIQLIMMFRKELGLLTAAQQAFNITAWANPYVLLAAAIAGLIAALYLYSDSATDAEKAQERLNEERDEFQKSLDDERQKIEECIATVQSKTATDYDQVKAYEELKKLCPQLTDEYTKEELAVANLADTTKKLNEIANEKTYENAIEQLQKWEKALQSAKDADGNWGKLDEESDALIRTVHSWGLLKNAIPKIQGVVDGYREQVEEMERLRAQAAEESIPLKTRIETQTTIVSDLQEKFNAAKKALNDAQKEYEAHPTLWNKVIQIKCQWQFNWNLDQLNAAEEKLETLKAQTPKTYKDAVAEARKELADANKAMAAAKKSGSAKDYTDAKEKADNAKKTLQGYGIETKSDKTVENEAKQRAKKRKELLRELEQIRVEGALKIESLELQVLEDGLKKKLRQIEIDRQSQIAAIEKERKALEVKLAEINMTIPEDVARQFTARITAVNAAAASEVRRTNEDNAKYIAGLYRTLSDVFSTEEQRKISEIKNRYKEQREQLEKDHAGGTVSDSDYNSLMGQMNRAEAKETEDYWLEAYGDYYQKRQSLQESWEANLSTIPAKYAAQARKQMQQELSAMDIEQFKKTFNWDLMFGDLGNQSIESLQFTLDKVKSKFEEMKESMTVTEIRDWQEAITNLENEIANRNPFTALHKSFKDISTSKSELVTALQDAATANNELRDAQIEYNDALAIESELREMLNRGEIAADDERLINAENQLTAARDKLNKSTEKAGNADAKVVTARNKVTKSYKQFATNLKSCGSVVTDLGGKASKLARVFSDDVADGMDKSLEFIDEIMDATADVIGAIGDVGKSVAKGVETTVDGVSQGTQAASQAAATSISTVEKASIILTVISAALQIATAIANLFNNDDQKQKEIEKLQERIDQLQWELDNADAVRLRNNTVDALEKVREAYRDAQTEILRLHGITAQSSMWAQWFGRAKYSAEIYAKTIEKIADYWAQVDYTADKALGAKKYDESRKQLENLAEQQLLVQRQLNEESSKKKSDSGKIQDYKNQLAELAEEMATLINEMLEDIIGTTAEDLASTLGDAFFEAAAAGEDAMQAWAKSTNELVADIIKRMLITQYLEPKIGEIFDKYRKQWFGTDGQFRGIDAVIKSADNMANDINQVGAEFNAVWEGLSNSLGKWFDDDSTREASQKGIATASQDLVDENNARLTTIQGHTYTLVQGMGELNSTANAMLDKLSGIEENTGTTADEVTETRKIVKKVNDTLDDITTRGIKLKN